MSLGLAWLLSLSALGCGADPAPAEEAAPGLTAPEPEAEPEPPPPPPAPPYLPGLQAASPPWGPQVLSFDQHEAQGIWAGSAGEGLWSSLDGGESWRQTTRAQGLSWDWIIAVEVTAEAIWYGTVGMGWGQSRDGGRSWQSVSSAVLGRQGRYVARDGIRVLGGVVYVATADGLWRSRDQGATWSQTLEEPGLPSAYLLSLDGWVEDGSTVLRVQHLLGLSESRDGGESWTLLEEEAAPPRSLGSQQTEEALTASLRRHVQEPRPMESGPPGELLAPRRDWLRRPVDPPDNVYMDQIYGYGSTFGGRLQQHQGVEFNNLPGTPMRSMEAGVVRFAGPGESGSLTVVVHHPGISEEGAQVWTAHQHLSRVVVTVGQEVGRGEHLGDIGATGRAMNSHLHTEVHVSPGLDRSQIVGPALRTPPHTRNPALWIQPLEGTGVLAGRVLDAEGRPRPLEPVYFSASHAPWETPLTYVETYGQFAHSDPLYGEHFAVGDLPEGRYTVGVRYPGGLVTRSVEIRAGGVSWAEFRPPGSELSPAP